jgi:GNAT superfamily N-acetyltransferase
MTSSAVVSEMVGPVFTAAFEANFADFFTTLGLTAGGVRHADAETTWYTSGVPVDIANGVVLTRFAGAATGAALRERITAVLAHFQARSVPMLWWITPSTQPIDLGAHQTALGLRRVGAVPGMVVDLRVIPDHTPVPDGLTIEEVMDEATLREWARTFWVGYGLPAVIEDAAFEAYRQRGLGPGRPLRLFLARLHGAPVATSSLLLSAGLASLNAVATLPSARRQGIGAAISAEPMRAARALGYRVGMLQASDHGHPVYQRLGFRDCFSLPLYAWTPAARS